MNPSRHREPRFAPRLKLFSLIMVSSFLCFFLISGSPAFAVSKEETLKKYEQVIAKSNELTLYGYDLRNVTFKLKQMTDVLLLNDFERANGLLDEIRSDLEEIESVGPEYLRRERKLAWLEIYGDLVQQLAIFVVVAFLILQFSFLKRSILTSEVGWRTGWKMCVLFGFAALFSGSLELVRHEPSSWAFIDLQLLFVAVSGMMGGAWVGLAVGCLNALFRCLIVPGLNIYVLLPVCVGLAAGVHRWLRPVRPVPMIEAAWIGVAIGFFHSFFVYVPISSFLPLHAFVAAIFFLTVAEASIFITFFVLVHQIYKEEKRKETERELYTTQLRFLRAQINPHFLFNALNTIAAICGEEKAERARRLIIQLSALFRRLTKSEGDFVPLEEELEYINAYLEIEKARFGDRLQVERNISLSPKGLKTIVPILAIQPLVENAVKHGLSKKAEGGKLVVRAEEKDSKIILEIADTGVGMDLKKEGGHFKKGEAITTAGKENHIGIGLKNVRERLEKFFGKQFDLTVTSAPDQGTVVKISLPRAST